MLLVYSAKNTPMFRSYGKEMDSSVYFTLYGLGKIAESLKKSGPYRQLSRYDRTKIAGRVYTLLSDKDLVIIKKIGPDTYITITQKGEDLSKEFLNGYRFG